MDKIIFTAEKVELLRAAYDEACEKGLEQFEFEDKEFLVSYAGYLLSFLEERVGRLAETRELREMYVESLRLYVQGMRDKQEAELVAEYVTQMLRSIEELVPNKGLKNK